MKYQIGQTVIMHRFSDVSSGPGWADAMDKYVDAQGDVERISSAGYYIINGWAWPESALSLPDEKSLPEEEPEPLLGVTSKYKAEPKPLDLTKILRVGDEIYSMCDGECTVEAIEPDSALPIKTAFGDMRHAAYYADGKFRQRGECVLFPSRINRNWATFKRKPDLKKGDIVKVWDDGIESDAAIRVFSHFAPLGEICTYNYADGTQLWQHVEKISVDELKDFV